MSDFRPSPEELDSMLSVMAKHGVVKLVIGDAEIVRVHEPPAPAQPAARLTEAERIAALDPDAQDAAIRRMRFGGG